MDRVVDYFAVTGLCSELTDQNVPYAETRDHFLDIVDICIVLRPEECAPHGFTILNKSMTGVELDKINKISKSVKNSRMFLCCRYRKQNCMNDKPGITNIRIVASDTKKTDGFDEIICTTCGGQDANFGTPQSPMYIAIKRESKCNQTGLDEEPIIQKLDIVNDYPTGNQMFTDAIIVSKTLWSSPVYLAFRRVASVGIYDLELPSTVIDVCPIKEHVDFPLPREALPLFSFPEGLRVKRCILSNVPVPKHFSYVMTMADDSKVYVSSILFYEPLESEPEITILNKMNTKKSKKTSPITTSNTTISTTSDTKSDDNNTNIIALTKKSSRLFRPSQFLTHTIPSPSLPSDESQGNNPTKGSQHQEEVEEEDKEVEDDDGPSNIFLSRRLSSMIRLKGIQKHIHGIKGVDPHSEAAGGHLITWVPKTISVLSHWPFYDAFREWLAQLYQMSISASGLPLERLISYFVLQCPLPTPGGPSLTFRLNCHSRQQITLKLPKLQALPLFDLSFVTIFRSLSVQQVLTTYCTLLLEKKVLLSSRRASIITEVCESLRILLFPIKCEFCYVPRLHSYLLDIMESPGGGLLGVEDLTPLSGGGGGGGQSPNYILANGMAPQCMLELILERMPDEMTYIDLDKHEIHPPKLRELRSVDIEGFLRKDRSAIFLQNQLQKLLDDSLIRVSKNVTASEDCAFIMAETPDMLGDSEEVKPLDTDEVRGLFLGFMVDLLYGYTDHLIPPSYDWRTSGVDWFNTETFLSQCEKTRRAFLTEVTKTQSFSSFIQRRTADSDHRLVFFDRCMEQKRLSKEKSKDNSAAYQEKASSSGGGGGGWQGLLFAARGKPALPTPDEEQDFEIGGFGGERRRAISSSSSFGKDRDRDISSHGDDNNPGDNYSSHGGLFAMGSLIRSSSSVNKEKITLPGPDRSGLPEGQVFSYIKVSTGLLCWPKLNPEWFLPAAITPATSTGDKDPTSGASMVLGNLSELLIRDSHQLQIDMVPKKVDNNSEIRPIGSTNSLITSPQQYQYQQHRPSVLVQLSNSVANLTQSTDSQSTSTTATTPHPGRLSRSSSTCSGGSDTVDDKYFLQCARDMGRDVYGIWFMFVPALMDTYPAPYVMSLSLGALLKMATQDHICPDEIILRSLILSCGKGGIDYRDDAFQLFQLLSQLKIKPDAITYGLFTQALSTEWHDSGVNKAMTPRSASEKISSHSSPHRSNSNGNITIAHSASLAELSQHRLNTDISAIATSVTSVATNSLSNFLDPLSLLLLAFGKRWKASKMKSALLSSRLDDDIYVHTKPSMATSIGSKVTSNSSSPIKPKADQSIAVPYSRSHDNNDQELSTTSSTSSTSWFPVNLPAGVCMTVCCAIPLMNWNVDIPPSRSMKEKYEESNLQFGDQLSSSSMNSWLLGGRVATLGLVTSSGDWSSGSYLDDQMMAKWAMDAATAAAASTSTSSQSQGEVQQQVHGLRLRFEWMTHGMTRPRSTSDDFDYLEDPREGRTDSTGSLDSSSRPDHMENKMYREREVPYLSPTMLRLNFENALLTYGNQVFFLSFIIDNCPELFWNICWYTARLGLPLPFIGMPSTSIDENEVTDSTMTAPTPTLTVAPPPHGTRHGSESEDMESVSTQGGKNDKITKETAATGGPLVVVCSYDPHIGKSIATETLRSMRLTAFELLEEKNHLTKPISPLQHYSLNQNIGNEDIVEVRSSAPSTKLDLNKNDSIDNQNEKYNNHDNVTPFTDNDISNGEVVSEDFPINVENNGCNDSNNIQQIGMSTSSEIIESPPPPPLNFIRPSPLSGLSKRLSFSLTGATATNNPTTSPTLYATATSTTTGIRRSSLRSTRHRRDDEVANLAAKALSMKQQQQQQQQSTNPINLVKSSKEINAAHDAIRKKKERTWSVLEEVKSSVTITSAANNNHDSNRDAIATSTFSGNYIRNHNLSSVSSNNNLTSNGKDSTLTLNSSQDPSMIFPMSLPLSDFPVSHTSPGAALATRQIFGQYMH